MSGTKRTCLVTCHGEGVNVALLRGITVRKSKLRWVQQFRSHVTDNSQFGRCCAARFHDGGIGDDSRNCVIPKACITTLSYQDVPLGRATRIGICPNPRTCPSLTGLISLCTILSEWRYSRPLAACASYQERTKSRTVCLRRLWKLHTSCNWLTSRCFWRYSTMFPFRSQGLMKQNTNNVSETPRKGSTFGCKTYFHPTISR